MADFDTEKGAVYACIVQSRSPGSARHHSAAPPPSTAATLRGWWTVTVLTIAYTFAFIDRQVINLLVTPIRRDLWISDTQISLLMGLSFALFYTLIDDLREHAGRIMRSAFGGGAKSEGGGAPAAVGRANRLD